MSALDLAPPVASPIGTWQPRRIKHRTAHFLASLQATAIEQKEGTSNHLSLYGTPIVVNESYFVAATNDGRLCIWTAETVLRGTDSNDADTEKSERPLLPPDFVVDTVASTNHIRSPLCGIAAVPFGTSLLSDEETATTDGNDNKDGKSETQVHQVRDHVVALSALGVVSIVTMCTGKASVVGSWNTGRCGACCTAVTGRGVVVVGYQSGYVEGWTTGETILSEGNVAAKLLWRGCFSSHAPIRSVAHLRIGTGTPGRCSDKHTETGSLVTGTEVRQSERREFLALTLQQERQRSTGSLLEVVNLESIEEAWKQLFANSSHAAAIPLEEHWILPEAGMELIDASSTLASNRGNGTSDNALIPRRAHWIPSLGTDSLLELSEAAGNASCAVGFSDGTVGILSAVKHSNDTLSWGIANSSDQLLLSYPCIGLGNVSISSLDDRDDVMPYAAFCLRGATTYLVPLVSTSREAPPLECPPAPLTAIAYPHDVDSDTTVQHLQGFRAGNLRRSRVSENTIQRRKGSVPALFFAWGGAIVDVYSCQPLPTQDLIDDVSVLEKLIDNGSVDLLKRLLLSLESSDPLLKNNEWETAWEECRSFLPDSTSPTLTLEYLSSNCFQKFRSLLLLLAHDEGRNGAFFGNQEF